MTNRLHTRAARRAVIAPDLERYVDPANVDVMVTDQVQAVRVRVERGLEVFENRLRDTLVAIWRWLMAGAVLFLICVVVGYVSVRAGHWLTASGGTAGAMWSLWILSRAGLDWWRLQRLSVRFTRAELDRLKT